MYFKNLYGGALLAVTEASIGPGVFQFAGQAGGSGPPRAALWEENPPDWFDLNQMAHATMSQALAINDKVYPTDVVGWYEQGDGVRHGCVWKKSGPRYLKTLPGGTACEARKINGRGDIVGWSEDAAGRHRAVLWPASGMPIDLGTIGGQSAESNSINAAGQIVGWAEAIDSSRHAFLWTPQGTDGDPANPQMLDLGTLNEMHSIANDINDQEHVVGEIIGANRPGFFWTRASGMTPITGLNATEVRALALNRNDVVVGTARGGSGQEDVAFRWFNGTMVNLNVLAPGLAQFELVAANDINSDGFVVGTCVSVFTGETSGFLLTPIDLHLDDVPSRKPSGVRRPPWAEITHILSRAVPLGGGSIGLGPNGEIVPIPSNGPASQFVASTNDVIVMMCLVSAAQTMIDKGARDALQKTLVGEAHALLRRFDKSMLREPSAPTTTQLREETMPQE
jgi:probable HAF family extracellular repeat protein